MAYLILQAIAIFVFSVGNDWLSVLWHRAREEGRPIFGAFIAMLLGAVGWLAILWVTLDSAWLMVPDILGTGIGTYYSFKNEAIRTGKVRPLKVTPAGILLRIVEGFQSKPGDEND